jgi:hypothetical protein
MTSLRTAALFAVAAVAAWGLKAVAIGTAGGLELSPFEGPLFFLGLALLVAAFVTAGLALTAGRPVPVRILGAIGALVVGLAVSGLIEAGMGALVPESAGWVEAEAGLWTISVLSAVVLLIWSRQREGTRAEVSRSA